MSVLSVDASLLCCCLLQEMKRIAGLIQAVIHLVPVCFCQFARWRIKRPCVCSDHCDRQFVTFVSVKRSIDFGGNSLIHASLARFESTEFHPADFRSWLLTIDLIQFR